MPPTNEPEDLTLYHLSAGGRAAKAVRCKTLGPDVIDAVIQSAARRITPDSTMIELAHIEARIGAEMMLVDVSRSRIAPAPPPAATPPSRDGKASEPPPPPPDPTLDPSVAWEGYDPAKRQLSAREWGVLTAIYTSEYKVSQADVDAIMGKARQVSAG